MLELEQRLKSMGALPAAPGVALEILRLNERDDADMGDLAEIVSRDPAIGSKLLKTANSSALGRQGMVSNFHDAVMFLGTRRVNMLALSFSLTSATAGPANSAFNYTRFWTASAVTTVASRSIAGMYAKNLVDEAFVAGLLCDLGQLILVEGAADLYDPVLRENEKGERKIHEIEHELLGANHASLARDLFTDWGLPTTICQAIGGHHDPSTMGDGDSRSLLLAKILHLASCCGDLYAHNDENVDEIVALGNRYFDMSKENCEALFESLRNEVIEFLSILDPSNMDAGESERLKARASERLMEQNLDLEQRFQTLSSELAKMSRRNAELETRANYDPLTGLQSRPHFEEAVSKHLKAALKSKSTTGLLMMDVDHFKLINDRHGHVCGDAVLAAIGEALIDALPTGCAIARWGGDEFIALCPEVDPDELMGLAELLLERISRTRCEWDSETIQPTLSIGGTLVGSSKNIPELSQMIRQADVLLYRAKNAGRNRVSIGNFNEAGG